MQPLLHDMCQNDQGERPTMSEVVARFDEPVVVEAPYLCNRG